MKYDNQLRYAANIIKDYDGRVPLSQWLKDFFKLNKQMGSRDRKTVSELVYGYYRLGQNEFSSVTERILAAVSVLNNLPDLKEYFHPPLPAIDEQKIFPFSAHLSEGVDVQKFNASFLQQPDLFIRVRPGNDALVKRKLDSAAITFTEMEQHCLAFPNSTKLDGVLEINQDAVIQDLSSQRTGQFLTAIPFAVNEVWDCCAASGGKAIMAHDLIPGVHITVSDKRKIIIDTLEERFKAAGLKKYLSFVADLTKERTVLPEKQYDLVIADVPCSGSGTWSRTPEQLYFFKEDRIEYYKNLQQSIISRVLPSVKKGGAFLYITCSVFKEENEDMANFILTSSGFTMKKMELLRGYEVKADTLFAALFTA